MLFRMAVAIAVAAQIITEIDGDGDFHTSGQFRSTHGGLVLVRADGQIIIWDIIQSTHKHTHTHHTHTHTTSFTIFTTSYIIYIECACLILFVCVWACAFTAEAEEGAAHRPDSFCIFLHAGFLSWSSLHVFGRLSNYTLQI